MSTTPTDRLLTPTKITAWLDCAHYLTLQRAVDEGTLTRSGGGFGAFAKLVTAKGRAHEQACLEELRAMDVAIYEPPPRSPNEPFDEWVTRVGNPFDDSLDVVYQMPFVHDGVRGVADFVIRVTGDDGVDRWEPMDAKLARAAAKPGHVLQLCFYAEAIAALTGTEPATLRLWLGSGDREEIDAASVMPYWRRLRTQLARLVDAGPDDATTPVPCAHCDYCEFADHCEDQWRTADALHYVAGLHAPDAAKLDVGAGIDTLAALAATDPATPVDGLRAERLGRLVTQATLQLEARADDTAPPPFRVIESDGPPPWGHGFEALPAPSPGDVYLDFEGDPLWRPDRGLFFLFGYLARDDHGDWQFHAFWAHDIDSEILAADALIDELARRRAADPTMHAYHYNHTERHALADLTTKGAEIEAFIESGLFVDLYAVARNAVQVGTESYGLKHLERLTPFQRTEDIHGGAGAVVEYEAYLTDRDPGHLDHIARYNEDDVRATHALHEWLLAQRPADLPWRDAHLEPEDTFEELDELVAALHRFDDDSDEHLLGDVMGYWLREWRAHKGPIIAKLESDDPDLVDDPSVIAGLVDCGVGPRIGTTGNTLDGLARTFTFPPQEIATEFADPKKKPPLYYAAGDGLTGYSAVHAIDVDAGELTITWKERADEIGVVPTAVAVNDWVRPNPKHLRLNEIGWRFVDATAHGDPPVAARALLHRASPAFAAGHGPDDGRFGDDLDEMKQLVGHLDGSCLAIQGPPGTGKTFRGAHIVHQLVLSGKRVGITAFSHHAIDNLLAEVVEVFRTEGDLDRLAAVRRVAKKPAHGLPRVTYETKNEKCANPEYNLVAGTTWLFANKDIVDNPVDVLIIDEAGQLSLTDALSTTLATTNVILLGDPQQLPQVSMASHPNGSGASVLEHLLGDERTISAERGIFLPETRRMHPDVCGFISDQFYESRLGSHQSCSLQGTAHGTGLRWLPAVHDGCSTESDVEAQLVADELRRLVGTPWTDHRGDESLLTAADVMVVAPYNDQVRLLRETLDRDPSTRGTRVGTVDKFQGQQAPVVMFSMATSSAFEMPRTADFLFSRNRLNVAISRARCLAYVVCTDQLLDSRARTVEDMQLISTLCAFAEYAG